MKKEITATGKTVEAAVAAAAEQLGVPASSVEYEVLEQPRKGFLGFGETPAKVKVSYTAAPEDNGLAFVKTVIADMGLEADAVLSPLEGKREFLITVTGKDAGSLIGHHGETLDALQYLTNLAANKKEEDGKGDYTRLSVDIENYRAKREEILRRLARRMAEKALKYRRNVALEPMNPYERRIIHSEVQGIAGVTTSSVGTDNNRRVVIYVDGGEAPRKEKTGQRSRGGNNPRKKPEPAAEPVCEEEESAYSIELNYGDGEKAPKKPQKRARFDDSLPEYTMGSSYSENEEKEEN